ncbi:FAD:protein FMN transferase [Thalassotalea litorea]|uniref:FAD:protein FMN transferase n=2 Tax=Thalassotalea litorea TaxID=2020715 RepID=A0A5R9IDM8_9GAMM|nr:FAD:protein FMN transferase [Thalassotalea litorea]
MGPIVYTVKLIANKPQIEQENLAGEVDQLLVALNKKMSTWDKSSELSLINQGSAEQAYNISDELRVVLSESIRLAKLTQGSLDVTVGPLVNLWSFGPENRPEKIPSKQQIDDAKSNIGINKLVLQGNELRKRQDALYVDLSAIAKGYAVDKVAELLEQRGHLNYLVDIGGEMRIKGYKIDNKPWRIAVEKPVSGTRAVQKVIMPGDNAVATSGDYRNYFEVDGVRYSHTIDPATGWPIDHKLVSVTVVHPSAMTADGLATAIEVMGPEKGFKFAKQHRLAVYLISKTDNGFSEQATDSFKQLVAE